MTTDDRLVSGGAWNTRTPDPESAVAAAWEEAARVAKDRWREWRSSYEDDLDGMDACEDISKAISARASAIRAACSEKTADGEITSNVGSSLSPKPDQGGRAVIELEEIARASNWKLVDGTMTTGESVIFDGSFIIAKVTRREDAELILALLSRDKLQS